MPFYDLPLTKVNDLEIAKTKKTVIDADKTSFDLQRENSFYAKEWYLLTDKAKQDLAKIFKFPATYAKKMDWELFYKVFDHFFRIGSEHNYLLVESTRNEAGEPVVSTIRDATLSELTLDGFIENVLINLPEEWKIRWIGLKRDTLYFDFQTGSTDFGLRVVADLNVKGGIKLFHLYNLGEEWRPAVMSEGNKVKTRGLDAHEIYEAIASKLLYLNDTKFEIDVVAAHISFAQTHYELNDHIVKSLLNLASARPYSVSQKVLEYAFSIDSKDTTISAYDLVSKHLGTTNLEDLGADNLHKYQVFLGGVLRNHSDYLKNCHFCDNDFCEATSE